MSLRSVLLTLLSREPNTGYGVGRLLNREFRHLWDARLQQIYGEFARLQEEGLVKAESIAMPNRPAKKVYSLTPAGEEALDDWLSKPPALHAAKDELLIQLSCLKRIPTGVIVRRVEQRRDDSLAEVTALRELILKTPRTDPGHLGHLLTLEAALARAGAEVSWCEKALAVLSAEEAPASRATLTPQPERLRAAR
jgi:DNA-binding PadR family transcriptional regulator